MSVTRSIKKWVYPRLPGVTPWLRSKRLKVRLPGYRKRRILLRRRIVPKAGYYSQDGQDIFLNEIVFQWRRKGVFFEFGAYDGIGFSNSYFFEKELGWTGVCLEPLPEAYQKLKRNRKCACLNACISPRAGREYFLHATRFEMMSVLESQATEDHVDRIRLEYDGRADLKRIQVQALTFNSVAREHGLRHIDYLSVDTEGGELDILRSIHFRECLIDVIGVENNYADPMIEDYLESVGYEMIAVIGQDELYRRREKGWRYYNLQGGFIPPAVEGIS